MIKPILKIYAKKINDILSENGYEVEEPKFDSLWCDCIGTKTTADGTHSRMTIFFDDNDANLRIFTWKGDEKPELIAKCKVDMMSHLEFSNIEFMMNAMLNYKK